jgi:hypothetical protein
MANEAEIRRRFTWQPPRPEDKTKFEVVSGGFLDLAHTLDEFLPEGREKALALTALQDARMWANAAIATAKKDEAP